MHVQPSPWKCVTPIAPRWFVSYLSSSFSLQELGNHLQNESTGFDVSVLRKDTQISCFSGLKDRSKCHVSLVSKHREIFYQCTCSIKSTGLGAFLFSLFFSTQLLINFERPKRRYLRPMFLWAKDCATFHVSLVSKDREMFYGRSCSIRSTATSLSWFLSSSSSLHTIFDYLEGTKRLLLWINVSLARKVTQHFMFCLFVCLLYINMTFLSPLALLYKGLEIVFKMHNLDASCFSVLKDYSNVMFAWSEGV